MSEQFPVNSPEHQPEIAEVSRAERPTGSEYSQAEKDQRIESARAALAAVEKSSAGRRPAVPHVPLEERPQLVDKAIKALRMRQNLTQLQKRLQPAQKSFSKIIHQPLIQKVSETSANTVARPSGLFGGGLVAFTGSLGYLWLTHHYSLPYNYFFFLLFFAGGFAIGLLAEYGLYLLHRLQRR